MGNHFFPRLKKKETRKRATIALSSIKPFLIEEDRSLESFTFLKRGKSKKAKKAQKAQK